MSLSPSQTAGIVGFCMAFIAFNALAQSTPVTGTSRRDGDTQVLAKTVQIGDLNLSSEAGIEVLLRRLHAAARQVCSPLADNRDLQRQIMWRNCRETAVANAVASINHPQVMAYVMRRSPTSQQLH